MCYKNKADSMSLGKRFNICNDVLASFHYPIYLIFFEISFTLERNKQEKENNNKEWKLYR